MCTVTFIFYFISLSTVLWGQGHILENKINGRELQLKKNAKDTFCAVAGEGYLDENISCTGL